MPLSETFLWAQIIRPHGFSGEVLISLSEVLNKKMKKPESVFVDFNGNLVPYFIDSLKINGNSGVLKLEDVDNEVDAKFISGKSLFLEVSFKPKHAGSNIFDQLIGYQVKDVNLGPLGVISEINEYPQQIIASMQYNEKEILFPLNESIIVGVDKKNHLLEIKLPEGLLDVYL